MAKESCTDIQVRNVPNKLLKNFDEKVVKDQFPGGRSEAIRYWMRRAIEEESKKGA
jgi:metal-responsive CopG/Arc/MetJ family transcriptional regulator